MTIRDFHDDRHRHRDWARWAGLMLLTTNLTAIFAFWARGTYMVPRDTAQTAANIVADPLLFRLGLVFDLLTVAGIVPLVVGLYIVLKPMGRGLAMLALLWRLIECALLASLTLAGLTALALVGGADIMRALGPLASGDIGYAMLRVQNGGFQAAFIFLGLGQMVFSLLWWRSRYIPRWLAGLGIVASVIMLAVAMGTIAWPRLSAILTMAYMLPMALYEFILGFWLAFRGVKLPVADAGP